MINFRSLSFMRASQRNKSKSLLIRRRRNGQENHSDPNIHAQQAPNSDSPQEFEAPCPGGSKRFIKETQRKKI
jgi:hypothetical protein